MEIAFEPQLSRSSSHQSTLSFDSECIERIDTITQLTVRSPSGNESKKILIAKPIIIPFDQLKEVLPSFTQSLDQMPKSKKEWIEKIYLKNKQPCSYLFASGRKHRISINWMIENQNAIPLILIEEKEQWRLIRPTQSTRHHCPFECLDSQSIACQPVQSLKAEGIQASLLKFIPEFAESKNFLGYTLEEPFIPMRTEALDNCLQSALGIGKYQYLFDFDLSYQRIENPPPPPTSTWIKYTKKIKAATKSWIPH